MENEPTSKVGNFVLWVVCAAGFILMAFAGLCGIFMGGIWDWALSLPLIISAISFIIGLAFFVGSIRGLEKGNAQDSKAMPLSQNAPWQRKVPLDDNDKQGAGWNFIRVQRIISIPVMIFAALSAVETYFRFSRIPTTAIIILVVVLAVYLALGKAIKKRR